MKTLLAPLLLLPLTLAFGDDPAQEPVRSGSCLPETIPVAAMPEAVSPASRQLALYWDDSLDGELEHFDKRCVVELERIDGAVTGRFIGPVEGRVRTATFTGEVVTGGALMLLQQREPGYVCSYQLSSRGDDRWEGTWRDSNGASGTAQLAVPEPPRHTETQDAEPTFWIR